jgi:hypothetical protein
VLATEAAFRGVPAALRRVVVKGDVFHDKGAVCKAGIALFFLLLRGLARLARVVVIRGNHDFVQERYAPGDEFCDTGDVIEALLAEAPVPGVRYLAGTGAVGDAPFGFGVLAVHDTCSRGGTAAKDIACPALPDPVRKRHRTHKRLQVPHVTCLPLVQLFVRLFERISLCGVVCFERNLVHSLR